MFGTAPVSEVDDDVGSGVSVRDDDVGARPPDREVEDVPSDVSLGHGAGSSGGDADDAASGIGVGDDGVGAGLPGPRVAAGMWCDVRRPLHLGIERDYNRQVHHARIISALRTRAPTHIY